METEIDIKELWRKQVEPAINPLEIIKGVKNFRKRNIQKIIIINVVLLLTICFAIFIWAYFKPQLLTTKIGIVITLLPMCLVVGFNYKLIPLYKIIDERQSNFNYLNELLLIKTRESYLQTKITSIYFILLSVGLSLYMYEYTLKVSLMSGGIAYSAFFLWVVLNWFVFRPHIIRKSNHKMNHLIGQIERTRSQLHS